MRRMNRFDLGEVIATRRLFMTGGSQGPVGITVLLGKPQPTSEKEEFICPFMIEGIQDEAVHVAYGMDAFQAIQEAIRVLGMYLNDKINPEFGNRLRWSGGKQGELGFPKRNDKP